MKSKLIRNLKPGDIIKCTDATRYPTKEHYVTVTHVQETRLSMSGKRQWQAFFTPHINWGSWTHIHGYSDDRVEVYNERAKR